MTLTAAAEIDALRVAMIGSVLLPTDQGYDDARNVWNGDIDRHPAVIARCASAADVAAAIDFARRHRLEISVRGGGHNAWGASVGTGGMMIHLGGLNAVRVDPAARRVRVGGGAMLADLDAATQAHGLATTAGTVSHTGVGGLTLGGGFGWLGHRYGFAIDNLVSAEVVTADGRILRASQQGTPDLFWALRGGGGNFGVVTEFEFQLHEVGPLVDFGLCFST
jgi:FAD/FMN-containing dehydrogenase